MIYETFLSLVSTNPLAPAVIEGASGQLFTRNDLLQRADALADEMTSRGLRSRDAVAVQQTVGLESMCVGGGQVMAMIVERLS